MIKAAEVIKNTLTNHRAQHPWLGGIGLQPIRHMPVDEGLEELSPAFDVIAGKQATHPLPKRGPRMACVTGRLKGGTTEFLDLVDQKGQDHKKPKIGGQMLLTMSVIMF